MDRWDMLIIAVAAYVAVVTLVRLMAARRNQLVDHVRQQIEQQHAKTAASPPADLSVDTSVENNEADRGAA